MAVDLVPVMVGQHLAELSGNLYDLGLSFSLGRIATGRFQNRSPAGKQAPGGQSELFDFCATTMAGQKVLVAWVRQGDLEAADPMGVFGARLEQCLEVAGSSRGGARTARRHEGLAFFVTRVPEHLDAFMTMQNALLARGVRCVPVGPNPQSVCEALAYLQREASQRRVMRNRPEEPVGKTLAKTFTHLPHLGDKACETKLLPLCRSVRGVVQRVKDNDPELQQALGPAAFASLSSFISAPISPAAQVAAPRVAAP